MCQILKPFLETTVVSGEKYITGSQVYVLVRGLENVVNQLKKKDLHLTSQSVVLELESQLKQSFKDIENSSTLTTATVLDPRFKLSVFDNSNTKRMMKERVLKILYNIVAQRRNEHEDESTSQDPDRPSTSADAMDELSVWSSFDNVARAQKATEIPLSRAIIELDRYLEMNLLPRRDDPLQWWAQNQMLFPNIAKLARGRLCVMGSSVPCEQMFSKSGLLTIDRRNRLSSSKINEIFS